MSKKATSVSTVIEWSPGAVAAYDAASKKIYQGASLVDIAPKLSSREAVMAVGRRACFVRSVSVPEAPKADLVQALTLTIGQHVPIGTADACVDLRVVGNPGPEGRTATLVAMRAADLRTMLEEAKLAGIKVVATVPAAYGSWVLANGTAIANCAAVSESAEGVGVDLITDGELRYSRALPPHASNGRLAPEIMRTFSAAGLESAPILAQGMPVSSAQYTVEKSPLEALSGTGWTTPGVEFELPETVAARAKAGRATRSRLAALLCLSALLLGTLVYLDRADAQEKVDKQRAKMNSGLRKFRATRDSLQLEVQSTANEEKVLQRGFEPAQKLGDVIALVSNKLPANAWLTGVNVERGQSLTIRGAALTGDAVADYVQALSAETRLRNVRIVFANNAVIESTPVVNFSITAFPVGNLPLVEKQTTKPGARKR